MELAEGNEDDARSSGQEERWWLESMSAEARHDYEIQSTAAIEDADASRQALLVELRTLTERFKRCNLELSARMLARLPHRRVGNRSRARF
jgi:hypothetical protein